MYVQDGKLHMWLNVLCSNLFVICPKRIVGQIQVDVKLSYLANMVLFNLFCNRIVGQIRIIPQYPVFQEQDKH